jgi:hypothetical protein
VGAFRASGTGRVGFRRTGGCAEVRAKSTKSSSDASRGEFAGIARSFPGQSHVLDETAGQTQLRVGANDEPCPAVGLLGCAQ